MSKIFSTPKMPAQQVISYTPMPTTVNTKADTAQQDNTADDSAIEKERINQILSRHRGRSGTIWTVGLSVLGIYVYKRSQEKKKWK